MAKSQKHISDIKRFDFSSFTLVMYHYLNCLAFSVLPCFEQFEGEVQGKTGANLTLQCSARGHPLPDVEWKVKKQKDEMVTACVSKLKY